MLILVKFLCFLVFLASLVPFLRSQSWYIRAFDFPRVHLFLIAIAAFIACLLLGSDQPSFYLYASLPLIAFAIDGYRIYPYLPVQSLKESRESSKLLQKSDQTPLSILSVNVRAKNSEYGRLIDLIEKKDPDIVVTVESNQNWVNGLRSLEVKYPYLILEPKENTYGICVYSKIPFDGHEVCTLVDPEVPSLFIDLNRGNCLDWRLAILHPRPPRPKEGSAAQRDAELFLAAKKLRDPDRSIVLGDLNDVAWSHTTRLFLRATRLLDPRKGRGIFNTFPAQLRSLGFPLDHVFHGRSILLDEFEIQRSIGSDHLPVFSRFADNHSCKRKIQPPEKLNTKDQLEIQRILQNGRKWEGPNEAVHWDD